MFDYKYISAPLTHRSSTYAVTLGEGIGVKGAIEQGGGRVVALHASKGSRVKIALIFQQLKDQTKNIKG